MLLIPPEMRSNFDYIFLLAEDIVNNRKNCMNIMLVCFQLLIFSTSFSDITDNYGVMVIDR
jgi:hypothetical protein